ncbi:MAG: L-threonylcarbamoyladenylate synthase [Myxococcota bacterium]
MSLASSASGPSAPARSEGAPDRPSGEFVSDDEVVRAIDLLAANGCVAFPTETVWGLAACARSEVAVSRLRAFKGRAEARPISLLVPDAEGLGAVGFELSSAARHLMDTFWPGPLTLVLPCTASFAPGIAREDGAVGLRCSPHPVAAALSRAAREAGLGMLTATSLNRSGERPASTESQARALCAPQSDGPHVLRVRSGTPTGAVPSSVLDLSGPAPQVLRVGAIPAEKLYSSLALEAGAEPGYPTAGEERE